MQTLMNDQPQPACSRPQYDSGERDDRDHHGGPKQALPERPLGRENHFQWLLGFVLATIFLGLALHR
jgi:hypothetical protein